jgi:hypothetical protein
MNYFIYNKYLKYKIKYLTIKSSIVQYGGLSKNFDDLTKIFEKKITIKDLPKIDISDIDNEYKFNKFILYLYVYLILNNDKWINNTLESFFKAIIIAYYTDETIDLTSSGDEELIDKASKINNSWQKLAYILYLGVNTITHPNNINNKKILKIINKKKITIKDLTKLKVNIKKINNEKLFIDYIIYLYISRCLINQENNLYELEIKDKNVVSPIYVNQDKYGWVNHNLKDYFEAMIQCLIIRNRNKIKIKNPWKNIAILLWHGVIYE